ncbi:uncharacterized protein LOC110721364 [Chenopodium quinoa]|uniref:uncharacterized protein LOC110721364 n=1 Tax=Chenopodium quinoa TaxID=63459 RepID=UPI000B77D613|nr:uncharacterized protein LOC110721364 [Chenopodium quinoa]
MSLQQGDEESLRDYLTRFSNESSRITNLDQGLAVFALRNGLQVGKFLDFMVMHTPQALEEALDASNRYIQAEEWNKAKSQPGTGSFERIQGSQEVTRKCNYNSVKPSKNYHEDEGDDEKEKEKDQNTKKQKGLSASAQGTPPKEKAVGGKARSSSKAANSES